MKFIERYNKELEENEEITWGIILKGTNKLIGTCCLGDFDEGARRAEIGYDITQGEWSKGYATEALEVVINFGFNIMNLNRIEATITPGNDASVRVLKKLNFTQEGIVRERDLIKGKLEDGIIMSILNRDYIRKIQDK
jgi:ribosomal-protein-alanine N-acetyltransferase